MRGNDRMKKKSILLCFILIGVFMFACAPKDTKDDVLAEKNTKNNETKQNQVSSKDVSADNNTSKKYGIWVTYWDTQNIEKELEILKDGISSISYFAAYFNELEKPFIQEETTKTYELLKDSYSSNGYKSYLTFVNDLLKEDGTSSLKDTNLLYHLLLTKESRTLHINEILTMTIEGGYDGIEMDYEAIKTDKKLWKLYLKFIKELYQTAVSKNIAVRVILEPSAPVDEFAFPEGPEYVMMCYNLYGYGTKPGPKANPKFIKSLVNKMKKIKGEIGFAFATGGFDFAEDETVEQLSEIQVVERMKEYDVMSYRDKNSQCLVYTYEDGGVIHEVWYADNTTIQSWIRVVEDAGDYGIFIWRLGGNLTLNP
jgi:spore germination protein YaaH